MENNNVAVIKSVRSLEDFERIGQDMIEHDKSYVDFVDGVIAKLTWDYTRRQSHNAHDYSCLAMEAWLYRNLDAYPMETVEGPGETFWNCGLPYEHGLPDGDSDRKIPLSQGRTLGEVLKGSLRDLKEFSAAVKRNHDSRAEKIRHRESARRDMSIPHGSLSAVRGVYDLDDYPDIAYALAGLKSNGVFIRSGLEDYAFRLYIGGRDEGQPGSPVVRVGYESGRLSMPGQKDFWSLVFEESGEGESAEGSTLREALPALIASMRDDVENYRIRLERNAQWEQAIREI